MVKVIPGPVAENSADVDAAAEGEERVKRGEGGKADVGVASGGLSN